MQVHSRWSLLSPHSAPAAHCPCNRCSFSPAMSNAIKGVIMEVRGGAIQLAWSENLGCSLCAILAAF